MAEPPIDLHALRRARGGRVWGNGRRWNGPGPGHSNRDASLSVRITDDGQVRVHSYAGDDFRACADHIGLPRTRGRTPQARISEEARRHQERQRHAMAEAVRAEAFRVEVWIGREPLGGSPAEAYLMGRGLPGPFGDDWAGGPDLAFHAAAPLSYAGQPRAPAMVALARDAQGRASGLHVTALKPGPTPDDPVVKAGLEDAPGGARRMFGKVAGGAVRLAPMPKDGVLAVAEGIETALSYAALYNTPCWAALSAPGVAAFVPPPGVERLVIAADGDEAGLGAAQALAGRLRAVCAVDLAPAPAGRDYNDLLLEVLR